MANTVNRAWHEAHVLGSSAPLAERVKWHSAHQKARAYRPFPKSVREAIALRHARGEAGAGVTTRRTAPRRR